MPALRKFMLMPPPMVPAPMTPTRVISRAFTSLPTSAILLAARSPKKAWRSAFDSVEVTRAMKPARSTARPSSNGFWNEASIASRHFIGAGNGPAMAATVLRATSRKPSAFGCSTLRLRTSGSSALPATSAARVTAAPTTSLSTTQSSRRVPASCSAATGSPETIMLTAVSRPTARGRRWVPPPPGRMPIFTSGRPSRAPRTATR